MKSFFFVLRHALRWGGLALIGIMVFRGIFQVGPAWVFTLVFFGTVITAIVSAFSHMRRVQLITGRIDWSSLANRHRRDVELPFPPDEAFDMVEAAIRELPHVEHVESTRDSLQVRARVRRMDPYIGSKKGPRPHGARRNQVLATVVPAERTGSVTLICEPEGGALIDWFTVDDGTNLENVEAITRSLTRRTAERRKVEETAARATATEKELTEARLSLLHAQVEPHFLYNTLASAQVLTRTDPVRADLMLGHLITYLRNSLPKTAESHSTLGDELERTRAYLEILKIRMGERLAVQVQVPDALKSVALPPMMLQTLAENAIKHGLEPVPGGGTIWIIARESEGRASITVADDGRGFSEEGGGTGIGLRNVRERLRLAYGDAATFAIVANFPKGVAATITVPK
jgi:histidine kinase/histidine kinase/DNA gyrase B/HSP90-like ATPase